MKYKYSEIISGLASGFSNLIFRWLLIGSVFVVAFQSATRVDAADQIVTRDQTLFGEIDSVSTQAVRFIPRGSTKSAQEIDVTDVVMVQFSGEPQALVESKKRLVENDFVGALEAIEQVSKDDIQSESVAIRGEYAYVRAAATGHVAMSTHENLLSALQSIEEVLDQFTRSIHYYDLLELAGDLETNLGRYDQATVRYKEIGLGSPLLMVRARRLQGNLLAAEDQHKKAIVEFEKVQSCDLGGGFIEQEKMLACLGRAESLISLSRFDEAISLVGTMLSAEYPDEVPSADVRRLLGKAYSILGQSFLGMKQDQEALVAYLTVDLVYGETSDTHAESLFRLFHLWNKGGYPRRAEEVREKLIKNYPRSTWAAELDASAK